MLKPLTKQKQHPNGKPVERPATQPGGAQPTSPKVHAVVAAGGTGKEVGHQIIADQRLASRQDKQVGFLDGDEDKLTHLPPKQRYILHDVPACNLLQEVRRDRTVYSGCNLLGDLDSLEKELPHGSDNLSGGSPHGERRLGLLGFLAHWWRYYSFIVVFLLGLVQALLKDKTKAADHNNRQAKHTSLVISMIGSACGGTGSALLLLVRDILQYLIRYQLGVSRIEFQAHIVLPGVFLGRTLNMQALMAKTYAFFIELLARYEQAFPPVRLGPLQLFREHAPFSWIYLYDTIGQQGRMLTSRKELAEVIKHVWEYLHFGPVAEQHQGLLEYARPEPPAIFSAAGIAGLEFPVDQIKKQGAHRTGLRVLQSLLEATPESEKLGQQQFQDFLKENPDFNHLPNLRQDVTGKPLALTYRQFATSLKHVSRQQLLSASDNVAHQVLSDYQSRLEETCQQNVPKLVRQIVTSTKKALNQPHGLQVADQLLTELDRHLAGQQIDLNRQLSRSNEHLEDSKHNLRAGQCRFTKLTLKARQSHIQARFQLVDQVLSLRRQSQQYQLLNQLREQVRALRQDLAAMARSLNELTQRLLAAETRYIQEQQARQSVVFQSLLDEKQIEQTVTDRVAEISQTALEGIRFTIKPDNGVTLIYHGQDHGLDGWHLASPEGVKQHLSYCQQFWQHLDTECSVESYLRSQGQDLAELIETLKQRATPWVAVNQAKQMPAEKEVLVLGTETGAEFVNDAPSDVNVVATGDKSRLVLLYTIHGLDIDNLEQAPAWKDAYDQAIAQGKRLHVVPEVDPLNDPSKLQKERK